MAFQQVYYTSCTAGLRGTKGFQINAASDGIEQSLLQQIERLGVYIPPVSAPTRPGPDEIAQFPVSLLFQPLGDGRAVIAQAKYIGADYSGRFGNYFTHSLISGQAARDFSDFLPIELWRSPSWVSAESTITTLPQMDQPQAGSTIDPMHVQEFLREGQRSEHLGSLLAAIQRTLATRRRVLIVEQSDAIAFWIAAASFALPRHLALQLSFNTYVKNPYQADALVVGVTPDSDFRFAPHEIEHQYFVFDFVGSRFTRMGQLSPFVEMAAAAYGAGRAEDVAGFGRFVESSAPDLSLDDLDAAFACYAYVAGLPVSGVDAGSILRWCAGRVCSLNSGTLQTVLAHVLDARPFHVEILDAIAVLHRAAVGGGVDIAKRTEVEKSYLQWLLKTAAVTAPADALGKAIRGMTFDPSIMEYARSLRSAWFGQVKQAHTDPARLGALLELGERLDYLAECGDVAQRLGESVIGPALSDRAIQTSLLRLATGSAGRDVIRGVGAYLATRVGDAEVFRGIGSILVEPSVALPLEDYAREQRAVSLYLRLASARVTQKPDTRVKTFQDCVAAIRDFGVELNVDHIENAFDVIWHDQVPTADEAIQLLGAVDAATLARTQIPRRLAQSLVGTADVRRPDVSRQKLATKLGAQPLYGSLGEAVALVDAFSVATRLARREGDPAEAIRDAIDCSRLLPDALAESLIDLTCRRLLDLPDASQHLELLAHATAADRGRFLRLYGNSAAAYLGEKPQSQLVARLFRVWSTGERSYGAQFTSPLIEQVLPRALRSWRKQELGEVAEALSFDPRARERWLRWCEDFAGGSVLGRFKHWLHLGCFLAIGSLVGWKPPLAGTGPVVCSPEMQTPPCRGIVAGGVKADSAFCSLASTDSFVMSLSEREDGES